MNKKLFTDGIDAMQGSVSEAQIVQFEKYSGMLVEWNEKMNLTAVTEPDGISVKHFLDSILPIYYIDFSDIKTIADIGTGAGFPGIPLKIMLPDKDVTLIDSLNKRINFLKAVCKETGLDGVECIHGRAEEMGKNKDYREKYDGVVSRAVANMTVLCEYCLPFVKVGGIFVALKAENADEELEAAKPMIGTLGGKVEKVIEAPLPMSDITRKLIVVRKVKETPSKFPRRADKIKKDKK